MMAARLMRSEAAELVAAESTEASLATDVEWPMIVRRAGWSSAFVAASGLSYETNAAYGSSSADPGDSDIGAWVFRLELAARHLIVLQRQLGMDDARGP